MFNWREFFFTSLSKPNVNNMKKNRTAQSWDTGSCDKASGYATKASPYPEKGLMGELVTAISKFFSDDDHKHIGNIASVENLTWFGDILDFHSYIFGHSSKRCEDDETSYQTCHYVHHSYQHGVPTKQQFY